MGTSPPDLTKATYGNVFKSVSGGTGPLEVTVPAVATVKVLRASLLGCTCPPPGKV